MSDNDVILLQGERRVLELIAVGAPLRQTLETLSALIDAHEHRARSSILVVATEAPYFCESYGSSLPDAVHQALRGLPIPPPYSGACSEAAHRGASIRVTDIAQSGLYTRPWRDLMASCGVASMCTLPILAPDGGALGVLAMYFDHVGDPRPANPRLIEMATHLARIALERARDAKLSAASADQFAALIEHAPFGTYVVDADFRLFQASLAARAAFGLENLIGMDLGDALRKMWPAPFASEAIRRFRHTLKTGEPFMSRDTVETRADIDAVEAYDWRIERLTLPDGRFGVVCYFYDLSERQRLDAELRASEARFASAFEQSPSFMAMLSGPQQVIETANPSYLKLVGRQDIIGRTVADALPDAAAQGYLDLLDRVYRTGAPFAASGARYDVQPIPGGPVDERFVDFVFQPLCDASGVVNRILVEGFDVTDRVRAETHLRESEERFRLIVDSATDFAIITLDLNGAITGWNSGAEKMMGYAEVDVLGRPGSIFFAPEDIAAGAPEAEMHQASETGRAANERWHVRRDGSRFWGSGLIMPLSGGRQRGYLKIFQDKTEAHQAGARLEQAVRERTRELETAQARLAHVQRMEALGQLAGGIAHDFNNVLQAVLGGAGLIERRAADPESVRRLARMVFQAASRGSAITRRLLAFSHRGDLRTEAVWPNDLLTDLREILTHTLGSGIGVRIDAPQGLPALLADKSQLETVLINLATNARDAMADNGLLTLAASIDIRPRPDGPQPTTELAAGAYVRLSVVDTGAGMTPEVLARVTEPFFTTKPQGQGTGLGLAMARGFIEQSGGAMRIESQQGHGTTVHLWLPVADSASALDAPGGDEAPARRGEARRVLVVDDEPLVREIVTQQLESAGYDVVAAGDPHEALRWLDCEPVDLVVCDLSMPGMDGLALLQEANRRRPNLPAILLTGFATNAAEAAVSETIGGLFSLLRKPVSDQELVDRVGILLEGVARAHASEDL